MQDPIDRIKQYYKNIGRVWCPILNDDIVFNSIGFRHLMRSGRRRRLPSDRVRRFRLLQIAPKMLANPQAKLVDPKNKISSTTKLFVIKETRGEMVITIVIRQVGNGNKHFFSIYN